MATKKSAVNPFDALAAAPKAKAKGSSKVAASVDDRIKGLVDIIIKANAALDAAKQEKDTAELEIIGHVRPQQDKLARSGAFTKSMGVVGNTGSLTYVTQDKWVCPQDEDTKDALRNLLGDKLYDKFFHTVRNIDIKPVVQENATLINKIVKAVQDAGLTVAEAFDVTDVFKAQKSLDEMVYELSDKKLEEFRALVKQHKPAVR